MYHSDIFFITNVKRNNASFHKTALVHTLHGSVATHIKVMCWTLFHYALDDVHSHATCQTQLYFIYILYFLNNNTNDG